MHLAVIAFSSWHVLLSGFLAQSSTCKLWLLQSALAIVEGMKSLGGQGCIGVTTGQLLCACVGSRIRAEYTVFGDSINLSARLMCKATAGLGDILCDYATHHMAPAAAAYTRLEPLVVCPQLSLYTLRYICIS